MNKSPDPCIFKSRLIPWPPKGAPILLIALQGIGNTIFLVPLIELLRKKFPENPLELLLPGHSSGEIFNVPQVISKVHYAGRPGLSSLFPLFPLLAKLRKRKFHVSILAFPANHPYFNLVSFLSGARFRIAHRYFSHNFWSLNFLNNIHVPLENVHDYEQNLGLILPLVGRIPVSFTPHLWIKEDPAIDRLIVEKYGLKKSGLWIGIHPGSSHERAMVEKRWAPRNFLYVIEQLRAHYPKARIFLFFGPDELDLVEKFQNTGLSPEKLTFALGDTLSRTIRLIRKMSLFIANDSGLMNIASALGVKTVSIAGGPTDPVRTRPYSQENTVLFSDIHCYPCRGLRNLGEKFHCIYPTRRCLESIEPRFVWEIIKSVMP